MHDDKREGGHELEGKQREEEWADAAEYEPEEDAMLITKLAEVMERDKKSGEQLKEKA